MIFSYKEFREREVVNKYHTKSKRLFLKNLRTINWQLRGLKVLLKVGYSGGFINEGVYETKKDLWWAFRAFTEKD